MAMKPSVVVVGSGNLATALALALRNVGYPIEAVMARDHGSSLTRAKKLARRVGARPIVDLEGLEARIVWLCVPDAQIAPAANKLAEKFEGKGKIALHSSGALTSDELDALRKRGARIASAHPLMTFVGGSPPSFVGVPFAIEGDPSAVKAARQIVRDLQGTAFAIRKAEKSAYHAWGTFASPLLTALLVTTEHVAELAGVRANAARQRMLPILLKTVTNYGRLGAARGFSGPIIRGDLDTVKRHLKVLRRSPIERRVYLALAQAAMQYLPSKNKDALKRLLTSK